MSPKPWQAQWKKPQFHKVEQETNARKYSEKDEKGSICASCSSELNENEVEKLSNHLRTKDSKNLSANAAELSSYILNVTVSTNSRQDILKEPAYGDQFVFSIFGPTTTKVTPNPDDSGVEDGVGKIKTIMSRNLRWPSCAFGDTDNMGKKGVVSICFCRVRESDLESSLRNRDGGSRFDEGQKFADAEEALRLLSFFGANPVVAHMDETNMTKESNSERSDDFRPTGTNSSKETQEVDQISSKKSKDVLMLCCLTNHGQVHLFSALDLMLASPRQSEMDDTDIFLNSFETLSFGKVIQKLLKRDVLPFSNPKISVPLSLCKFYHREKQQLDSFFHRKKRRKKNRLGLKMGIGPMLDLTFFDATMDPSLAQYRTITNKATFCLSSRDYIIVCGTGVRYNSFDRDTTARDQETKERGKHKESSTKQKNEDDSNVPLRNDDSKMETSTYERKSKANFETEGGFITFISLRHMNETKSLFLPFAPAKLSAIEWEGKQFVVCLRGPYTKFHANDMYHQSQLDETDVILVRVDTTTGRDVRCNSKYIVARDQERSFYSAEESNASSKLMNTKLNNFVSNNNRAGIQKEIERESMQSQKLTSTQHTLKLSFDEESLSSTTNPSLREIRRFKPIPVKWNICDISKLIRASTSLFREKASESDTRHEPQRRVLDMNMNSKSSPPSLVVIHEIKIGSRVEKLATLHCFEGIDTFTRPVLNAAKVRQQHPLQQSQLYELDEYDEPVRTTGRETIISTSMNSRHYAVIDNQERDEKKSAIEHEKTSWCLGGQGWSIVGGAAFCKIFFICWEGATVNQGAHVQSLCDRSCIDMNSFIMPTISCNIFSDENRARNVLYGTVIEESNFEEHQNIDEMKVSSLTQNRSEPWSASRYELGFTEFLNSFSRNENLNEPQNVIKQLTDTILEDLKSKPHRINSSLKERSNRLLRVCSSWNELEACDYSYSDQGIIVATIHDAKMEHYVATLRREASVNRVGAPVNQILSWLCQTSNYIVATAIALNLLDDSNALRDLRESILLYTTNKTLSLSTHEGLLDGIYTFLLEGNQSPNPSVKKQGSSCMSQEWSLQSKVGSAFLSDMALGCMVKGGSNLENTLKGFLAGNQIYDKNYACILLAAISSNETSIRGEGNKIQNVLPENGEAKSYSGDLWPIRCILQVAKSRDCIGTCLQLLNFTIPKKLRTLPYAIDIVTMILSSSSTASSYLLDLEDSSGKRYWETLNHETQMIVSLLPIQKKYPLLDQSEVQHWVISSIHDFIIIRAPEASGNTGKILNKPASVLPHTDLPVNWRKRLCIACMENASCNWVHLIRPEDRHGDVFTCVKEFPNDRMYDLRKRVREIRDAISPQSTTGGIDFGILIPTLLAFELRSEKWHDDANYSTQELLNESCYAAGRKEFSLKLKSDLVMKQCALSGNVMAAANLIGGTDGLVLKCCHVLMNVLTLPIRECEEILLQGKRFNAVNVERESEQKVDEYLFQITDDHRALLLLLEDHVLSIQKYGEFDTKYTTGRVNPVFAGRIILRTWLIIVKARNEIKSAAHWLKMWLGDKLCLGAHETKKRLASAALVQILLWPDESDSILNCNGPQNNLLAEELHLEAGFLTQLSQVCCGMVECLPKSVVSVVLSDSTVSDLEP